MSENPFVHLELHTGDLARARAFYTRLFGWRTETIPGRSGAYVTLEPPGAIEGGVVQCPTRRPLWLPYVEVEDIGGATDEARLLGARVALEPREGPAGWRSVVTEPSGAEIALWQPKDR